MTGISGWKSDKALTTWPIALLRIYCGLFFLIHGWGKVTREGGLGGFAEGMAGFLGTRETMFDFYRGFVEAVVIPNQGFFAFLVAYGELFLGLAMILGLATRYAALAGVFMVLNFWFAKGLGFWAGQNHDVVWAFILLALALVPAGHVYGLDAKLSHRFKILR